MKKVFLMAFAVVTMTACEKDVYQEGMDGEQTEENQTLTKKFTFAVKGDFSDTWKPVTRGYLQADGKDMTDLWVFDFVGNECVQSLHQTNTDTDFGTPVMHLAYGAHHVYFVASRGASPTVNETAKTITWGTVRDTFWKDYEVSVVSTSNGNRSVTLDRVATRLRLTVTDEVPATCATVTVTPETWYNGMNYTTGEVAAMPQPTGQTVAVPSSYIGTAGELMINIFGLSWADEWNTDVEIVAKDGNGENIGRATIEDAPMKANRTTDYSGMLFATSGATDVTLNATWETALVKTW